MSQVNRNSFEKCVDLATSLAVDHTRDLYLVLRTSDRRLLANQAIRKCSAFWLPYNQHATFGDAVCFQKMVQDAFQFAVAGIRAEHDAIVSQWPKLPEASEESMLGLC